MPNGKHIRSHLVSRPRMQAWAYSGDGTREKTDPRTILADAIGYFENALRMKYPEYRRQGLPKTSAHMESFVKKLNARVKGTEKFWNDGLNAEGILQIRAAALWDDDRRSKLLENRPGNPYHPNVRTTGLNTAA